MEKYDRSFFRQSLFAAANFWKRRARAKQNTAVITHSPFISSDRYLFVQEAYFQDQQIHVAPLALDQRQALVRSANNQR